MAMNFGVKTTKLYFGHNIAITNDDYDHGFSVNGAWDDRYIYDSSYSSNGGMRVLCENDYIDIGFVTDEREEIAVGGIPLSFPGTSAGARLFWAVGGKILRVTISGIIPDGNYVATGSWPPGSSSANMAEYLALFNNKSNISVFRYKMNKRIAYANFGSNNENSSLAPHIVQYRRVFITEITPPTPTQPQNTQIAKWVMTGYSINFMEGTRVLRYTITLDLSNNLTGFLTAMGELIAGMDPLTSGIGMRRFGDIN
jgi:hypothetical protein